MTTVETLATTPAMGLSFARALIPSRAKTARIPERTVRVSGLAQDPARLAEYSRVCGFTLRSTVPPTWLHVLTFPLHVHLLGDPSSSIRLVGAVHVSNTMTLHAPVEVNDRLTIEVRAANLRPHKRGALVDLVGQISVQDALVWEGTSTYLAQGARVAGQPTEVPRLEAPSIAPQAWWKLAGDLGRRYRAVSTDPNPIHTSRVMARALGFPRPVIHGMWTHARALAALDGRVPETYTAEVGFTRPVFLPSVLGFGATSDEGATRVAVTDREGSRAFMIMNIQA